MDIMKFFFKNKDKGSKNIAKERLKLVLVHDRSDFSPQLLEEMKEDIIKVISKYARIQEDEIIIQMTKESRGKKESSTTLVANVPIIEVANNT